MVIAGHAWRWMLACLAVPLAVCAQGPLSPDDVGGRQGEYVSVEGVVSQATLRQNGTLYLNFGGAYPNHVFTIKVLRGDSLPDLRGRRVRASGRVELAGNKPQIFLGSPDRLEILDSSDAGDETQTAPRSSVAAATRDPPPAQPRTPAATPKSGPLADLKPGKMFTFEAPLDEEEIKASKNNARVATVGVIVPENFDPRKTWPFFVVFASNDGKGLNVQRLPMYADLIVKNGYVGIAADGPLKPDGFGIEYEWAVLNAGMRVLESEWPGSSSWPMAMGGNSGGAKKASISAAIWTKKGRNVSGLFLGGCNQQYLSGVAEQIKAPPAVRKIPVYISNGRSDTVATPRMVDTVERGLKAAGFKHVRRETYDGGHGLNKDEFEKALRWFGEKQTAR